MARVLFFCQAEDGIRDVAVTGVQTCALPISFEYAPPAGAVGVCIVPARDEAADHLAALTAARLLNAPVIAAEAVQTATQKRSEERRVGEECRSRWSPYH